MKKILTYTIIVVLVGFLSCEQFLDEEFLAGDSTERRYGTPEGMENLISAAYTTSKIWYGKEEGYDFDIAYTSVLKRALRTLWLCLEEMDRLWNEAKTDGGSG